MADIEIEVDGLAVPVDADEWAADREAVIARVRHNREAVDMSSPRFNDEADAILGND